MKRRTFLRGGLVGGALSVAVGSGLLKPAKALAAIWPEGAFHAKSVDGALQALFGTKQVSRSGQIKFKAPESAENGAVVPVTVATDIDGVESISIIAEKNASPLIASFDFGPDTEGYVSTHIKLGKTGKVTAVVRAQGKLYSVSRNVKVTIGGCGG